MRRAVALMCALMGCEQGPNHPGARDAEVIDMQPERDVAQVDMRVVDAAPDLAVDQGVDMFTGPIVELDISGSAVVGFGIEPAARAAVIGRCGDERVDTTAGNDGSYSLRINTTGCEQVTVEFVKEGFLPVLRVIPVPPPTTPVQVDARLAELQQLICGEEECIAENNPGVRWIPGAIQQGWVGNFSENRQLAFLAGQPLTIGDEILWVLAFGYYDLRDADGRRLTDLNEPICVQISSLTRDQIGDGTPNLGDGIVLPTYTLEPNTGRWVPGTSGYLGIGFRDQIEPATEAQLGDVRAGAIPQGLWACGRIPSSGWIAWGLPFARKHCLAFDVVDECDRPIPNAIIEVTGDDHGFRDAIWTDRAGQACMHVAASEDVGEDLNHNGDGGESFRVDVKVGVNNRGRTYPANGIPSTAAGCFDRASCVPIRHVEDLPGGCE